MAQEGSEAKREFERNIEHTARNTYRISRVLNRVAKKLTKFMRMLFRNFIKPFFVSPLKSVQKDGKTKGLTQTKVEGGLTREQTKEILLKAKNDGVAVMVKEITPEDRVRRKTVHQQDKIYETSVDVQKWEHRKNSFLGRIPIFDKMIDKRIYNAKVNFEKDNMDNNDKRYIVFANISRKDWLNESLIIARDKTLENKGINHEPIQEDYTKDVGLKVNELEYDKNITDIEIESYKSNYIEVHMTKEEYVKFDERSLQEGNNEFASKMFSGDDYVTVRFNKAYYDKFKENYNVNAVQSVKEIGSEDGITLKQGNIPVVTQVFKQEKEFEQFKNRELDGKDYIATHNQDGSVTLKYSANIIVNANKEYSKKQQALVTEIMEEKQVQKEDKDELEIGLDKTEDGILKDEMEDIGDEMSK
jgi:hypothetical protein